MDTAHRCLNKQAKERKPVEDTWLRKTRTFLVAQWIGICLPMQGDTDGFYPWFGNVPYAAGQLSQGTTTSEPVALQPTRHYYWACVTQLLKPAHRRATHNY